MAMFPTTMTAIDPQQPGGPEVLASVERPVPRPGEGEVLVRVAAAGVNRPDILQRRGLYPLPPGAPSVPGLEIAGVAEALGPGVQRWRPGDRLCALVAGGGYAGFCAAPQGQCLPVPAGLSLAEAAALPETWFTVWSNLHDQAGAGEGDRLLVHGGTSGIGVAAIGYARLTGARLAVTAGTPEKCAAARALGADLAIDYRRQDYVDEVRRWTDGHGVDVVLDMVGGDYVPRNLACLAPGGRHLSIAFQRGSTAEVDLARVMGRRLVLTGSLLRPRPVADKAAIARQLEEQVWPALADGRLRAHVHLRFPLARAAQAHRAMEDGQHIGKIVLIVDEELAA